MQYPDATLVTDTLFIFICVKGFVLPRLYLTLFSYSSLDTCLIHPCPMLTTGSSVFLFCRASWISMNYFSSQALFFNIYRYLCLLCSFLTYTCNRRSLKLLICVVNVTICWRTSIRYIEYLYGLVCRVSNPVYICRIFTARYIYTCLAQLINLIININLRILTLLALLTVRCAHYVYCVVDNRRAHFMVLIVCQHPYRRMEANLICIVICSFRFVPYVCILAMDGLQRSRVTTMSAFLQLFKTCCLCGSYRFRQCHEKVTSIHEQDKNYFLTICMCYIRNELHTLCFPFIPHTETEEYQNWPRYEVHRLFNW